MKPETRDFIRQVHRLDAAESATSGEQGEQPNEGPLDEQDRTQRCRFCSGDMHVTGSTVRPRVSELLEMPLARFREARAGLTITLGERLARIEAERSGDPSAPVIGERYRQIRAQLGALMHSSYL